MRVICLILICFLTIVSCGEEKVVSKEKSDEAKKNEEIPEEEEEDFGETECVPNEDFESGKTGLFEPRAVVKIVSFEDTTYSEVPSDIVNGEYRTINQIESITLNDEQKKQLESILYKTRTKRIGNVSEAASCYVPRHAIVYAGSKETVAFQEICFECSGQRVEGEIVSYIDFCDSKWSELKEFFKSVGITYFGPN